SSLLSPTLDFRSLSLHDALPISHNPRERAFVSRRAADHTTPLRNVLPARWRSSLCHGTLLFQVVPGPALAAALAATLRDDLTARSEEHTSELQSRENLVCRLLLE